MVARVKKFKAGFVRSDANVSPKDTLADVPVSYTHLELLMSAIEG